MSSFESKQHLIYTEKHYGGEQTTEYMQKKIFVYNQNTVNNFLRKFIVRKKKLQTH